jgi:leucyl aminopeptidase
MNILLVAKPPFSMPIPAILLVAFENERISTPASLKSLLQHLNPKEFDGSDCQLLVLHTAGKPGLKAARVVLLGLGKRAEFNLEKLRRAVGNAFKRLRDLGIDRAAIQLNPDSPEAIRAIVESVILANYKFTEFKDNTDAVEFKSLTICLDPKADLRAAKEVAYKAQITAESTNYARAIGNLPPNVIYPASLAQRARELADELQLACLIYNKTALEKDGFGGLLAVGGGSAREPHLIVLEYNGGPKDQKPFALVGKAITFDTGGISIKPSDRMEEMKFDKCGGCAVLGLMRAVALLKLPINVIGVIASAENMPSATSYRPSDIVTSYKGKAERGVTIEVLNTDAEGRIVLGDALAYAVERDAQAIVDFATLTGAVTVALGSYAAGLFGNNSHLIGKMLAAGERSGERCWQLPLDQFHTDRIKSDVADQKNTGGREAGSSTAAAFLARYVGNTPWAHLDIAATAWTTEERPYFSKGATGFGVRLVVDLLSGWSGPV